MLVSTCIYAVTRDIREAWRCLSAERIKPKHIYALSASNEARWWLQRAQRAAIAAHPVRGVIGGHD